MTQKAGFLPSDLARRFLAPGASQEGERRNVTVLFVDLAGSTEMVRRLGSEDMADVLDSLLVAIADTINRFEGTIIDLAGDGALCIFGAPTAHEDDPQRALSAALAIARDAGGSTARDPAVRDVALRIGVHTGDVVVRALGGDYRLKYSAVGDAVHLAQRLQASALPREILVSAATRDRAGDRFRFGPERVLSVKGFDEGVAAAPLLGESAAADRVVRDRAFVGRAAELDTLRERLAALAVGAGGIATIIGEPGIGKSRLLEEARSALPPGILWLQGRADSYHRELPYWTVGQTIRRAAAIEAGEPEESAQDKLRSLIARECGAERGGVLYPFIALAVGLERRAAEGPGRTLPTGRELQRHIVSAIRELLAAIASHAPVVVALEDLHWADAASVAVIDECLSLVDDRPILVALVSRPEHEAPAWRIVQGPRPGLAVKWAEIRLRALPSDDTRSLVRISLGGGDLSEDVQDLVATKAEGVPLFIEELTRSLVERGDLRREGDVWRLAIPASELVVPDTLQGVILSRIDRLPDPAKRVLQVSSVIGRVFSLRILEAILPKEDLSEQLQTLQGHELILANARGADAEFTFRHALIQDVAYQSLLARRRASLHALTAEAMERTLSGQAEEFRPIVAEHYLRAERWTEAVSQFVRAADSAARLYANTEARLHYLKALEAVAHLEASDDTSRLRVDVTTKLLGVSARSEDPSVNLLRLREAEAIARELSRSGTREDELRLATTQYWLGRVHYYRAEPAEALRELRLARQSAERLGHTVLETLTASIIGSLLVLQGRFGEALPLLARTADALRDRDPGQWCRAAGYLGMAMAADGRYARAAELGAAARDRAATERDLSLQASAHLHLCVIHLLGGQNERMRDDALAGIEVTKRSGDQFMAQTGHALLGWAQGRLGLIDEGQRHLARRKELGGRRPGDALILNDLFAVAEAELALAGGRFDDATKLAADAIALGDAIGSLLSPGMAQRTWAVALARSGAEWGAVEPHLRLSLRAFESGACKVEAARTHLVWGTMAPDADTAARHLREATPLLVAYGLASEAQAVVTERPVLRVDRT